MKERMIESNDVERAPEDEAHLTNDTVRSLTWDIEKVEPGRRLSTQLKAQPIIESIHGAATAGMALSINQVNHSSFRVGELMAIMGPSGSGKTTLLNVLAHRKASFRAETVGTVKVNGVKIAVDDFQAISSYVEQEDSLIGSLTVRETLDLAARLALSR